MENFHNPMNNQTPLLSIYYLVTPGFILLEYLFGIQIRLTSPWENSFFDILYYLVCFIAGIISIKSIHLAAVFAMTESSINILLLLVSIYLPLATLGENVLQDQELTFKFGVAELLHLLIAGGIAYYAFQKNLALLHNR